MKKAFKIIGIVFGGVISFFITASLISWFFIAMGLLLGLFLGILLLCFVLYIARTIQKEYENEYCVCKGIFVTCAYIPSTVLSFMLFCLFPSVAADKFTPGSYAGILIEFFCGYT